MIIKPNYKSGCKADTMVEVMNRLDLSRVRQPEKLWHALKELPSDAANIDKPMYTSYKQNDTTA